ncbi:phage/plasmid replication domain-containing protein [Spirosoma panaciterrae]|uniref:phage/plasmid replication domain-containing protein n=1 Tax=Spirosoma panaciterrae TaxID=496058 RepID=UPI00035D38BA|nr:phage/plasmid replication protein [Spirosoma panaciterrae]
MIDTIHLLYDFNNHKELEDCIESMKERYSVDCYYRETSDNSKYSVRQFRCWDDGFKIWITSNQLHLEGSLTKLYFGNNIQQLNNKELAKAYELLISKFDLVDWTKAVHKRIDFGINVKLSFPPRLITNKIIGGKRMKKSVIKSSNESVTIGNNSQSMIFYNKTLESKGNTLITNKLGSVPDNLLRIEYRIMGTYPMKKYFGTDRLTIPYILANLNLLPKIWYDRYLNIEKDYSNALDLFSNKKEMEMKAILYFGLEPMKSLIIESYKAHKMPLSTKQNLLRYLRELTEYQKINTGLNDISKELDREVEMFLKKNLSD